MTADYRTARGRLAEMVELLNTDDDAPVTMLYPMTVADSRDPDFQPLLGVIADGDLVALAEHRCDPLTNLRAEVETLLTTLRAEVKLMRDKAQYWLKEPDTEVRAATFARRQAFKEVLDLIDKQREQQ